MTQKVFLMRRSGSGKSTVVSYIRQGVGNKIPVFYSEDYPILFDWYMHDEGRFFEPADPRRPDLGFNIKNPMTSPVWNIALQELEQQTRQRMQDNEERGRTELVVLEFARRDHREALKQFSAEFLQDSHFLLIEANVPTAIQRIRKRAEEHGEHIIGDEIIAGYFGIDNYPFMKTYSVLGQKVECILNEGLTEEQLRERADHFVEGIFPPMGKVSATVQPLGLAAKRYY